jgi:hypothetical protein
MTILPELSKDLRSYFIKTAVYGVGIWLGLSLAAAVVIYFFMGFLGAPDIKRHFGFWGVVAAGFIQSAAYVFQLYRQAKRVRQEIKSKEMEKR